MTMTDEEVEKSFERIQRRRMPLHMVAESWGGGYDLRDTELCVFLILVTGSLFCARRQSGQETWSKNAQPFTWGIDFIWCWKTSKQSTNFYLECIKMGRHKKVENMTQEERIQYFADKREQEAEQRRQNISALSHDQFASR